LSISTRSKKKKEISKGTVHGESSGETNRGRRKGEKICGGVFFLACKGMTLTKSRGKPILILDKGDEGFRIRVLY